MPSKRPDLLEYDSVAELYAHYEAIFLAGNQTSHTVESACGHTVSIFDHNFFHMVKLDDPNKPKPLLMAIEKPIIRSTVDGFGPYTYHRQRALHLRSAFETLCEPDEIWEIDLDKRQSATWFYLKEFAITPYSFTVLYMALRDEGGIVPTTSYPLTPGDMRRCKKRGRKIYP